MALAIRCGFLDCFKFFPTLGTSHFLNQEQIQLCFIALWALKPLLRGLAAGSFSVLLLRLTAKRFSATQFALFSSMVAITRVLGGSLSGFAVSGLGWTNFYYMTMLAGIPGLIFLQRFSPMGVRDPYLEQKEV